MSKIIVTISGSTGKPLDDEVLRMLEEDAEDLVRWAGVHGIEVAVEVIA